MRPYEILDDYIPESNQIIISGLLNNPELPWFYNPTTTTSVEKNQRHQYTNTFVRYGKEFQPNKDIDLLKQLLPFPEYKTHTLWRIKFNLNNPYKNQSILKPHIDIEVPGIVYLYYVNDSDGDTRLYPKITEGSQHKWWKFRDVVKVSPKQGRVIRMSSNLWHSSCNPHHYQKRIVGNFVFIDPSVSVETLEKLKPSNY